METMMATEVLTVRKPGEKRFIKDPFFGALRIIPRRKDFGTEEM
jgi:hypothetical protein